MHLPMAISNEITSYLSEHLEEHPLDYACVYGSSVYAPDKLTSDVDMFVVSQAAGSLAVNGFVSFIKDLHRRYGRELDAEVPYENKVHYTEAEVEQAVQFSGFDVSSSGIVVPPVRKEPAFLNSPAIKARLALNGLTTPHAAIGNNFSRYHRARERAGEAVTLLAIGLQGRDEFTVSDLHDRLAYDPQTGASGEMFLGYKTQYPLVSEYLQGVLSGALERLDEHGVVLSARGYYAIKRDKFDPVGYMKNSN